MKKGLLILILALAAGLVAFWVTRTHQPAGHQAVLLDSMPELAWLRGELKLSDDQFAKASALHTAYRPQCVAMCAAISEARTKLATLTHHGRRMTPELAAAIREYARVQADCQQHMLEHLYQTADLMDDRQAARYLESTLAHALDTGNSGADDCHHD